MIEKVDDVLGSVETQLETLRIHLYETHQTDKQEVVEAMLSHVMDMYTLKNKLNEE